MRGLSVLLPTFVTVVVVAWEVDPRCLRRRLEIEALDTEPDETIFTDDAIYQETEDSMIQDQVEDESEYIESDGYVEFEEEYSDGQKEDPEVVLDPQEFTLQDSILEMISNETEPVEFPLPEFRTADDEEGDETMTTTMTMMMKRELQRGEEYNLRLYWERGVCWQEEMRERWWCMQCKGRCVSGAQLWLQKCKSIDEQRFYFTPSQNGHLLHKSGTNLCLERVGGNRYELRKCNGSNPKQIFQGFSRSRPFELYPNGDKSRCINQHHHPKQTEIINTTSCRTARIWKTNRWIVYHPGRQTVVREDNNNNQNNDNDNGKNQNNGGGLTQARERKPTCHPRRPCNLCEGDCDNDRECQGDLKCFRRGGRTRNVPVPGCKGKLKTGLDYCYNPKSQSSGSNNSNQNTGEGNDRVPGTKSPVRRCSPDNPCSECEGDCNRDNDCQRGLRCFLKNGPAYVPGCGHEASRTDFCVRQV